MRNLRRLRVTCRAARIDEKRIIILRHILADISRERIAGKLRQRAIEIVSTLHLPTRNPDRHRPLELIRRRRVVLGEFRPEHEVVRIRDVQAMGKRTFRKICVDEGGRRTRLYDPEPGNQIFGPVFHHKCNDIAPAMPLPTHPARVFVRLFIVLAIGEGPVFEIDCDVVRSGPRQFLDDVRIGAARVGPDLLQLFQRTEGRPHEYDFVADPLEKTHSRSSPPADYAA